MSQKQVSEVQKARKHWVGNGYDARRLLLLGESAYSWWDNGKLKHPPVDHAENLVRQAKVGERGSFMNTLTRGLTGRYEPTDQEAASAWDSVAFTNYVPGTIGEGARKRPTWEQWIEAGRRWPALLAELQPRNVIVLGKEMWGKGSIPDADVWLTDDVQAYKLPSGEHAMCWAVRHPSGGLSWARLAQVIAFAERREIRSFGHEG